MAVAVSRAVEGGARGVVCASTGNTAASAAAYAARAGIDAAIVVPAGAVAAGKLAQVAAAGAELVEIEGDFGAAFAAAEALASERRYVIVNSTNPDRVEGQSSAAAEVVEQLGGVPDVLCLPYGGGGNTKAYVRGFEQAVAALPRIYPAQAERRADTAASAIRIVEPVHRAEVDDAVARSGGAVVTLSEDEIARAWRDVGRLEGIFCEPASAASVGALARGVARSGERAVCVLTGHGLKDPDAIARLAA
jgi:threonine synthase